MAVGGGGGGGGGGGLKGHILTQSSSTSSGGGKVLRSYGLMLLLVFGSAILGVMALNKLRERRIFNLLIREKDRQINSLHSYLQKEREYAKESKRKQEEMKAKLYSLRTQKMELNSRILEMQSTISSLKEEHKAMESALEEMQTEIKLMRDKENDVNKENHHRASPTEVLRQKEAEIRDMKRNLYVPIKVWSVSTDDPSNPPVNLTTKVRIARRDEEDLMRNADGSGNDSINGKDGENATPGEGRREIGEEKSQELEGSRHGFGNGNSSDEKGGNATEAIVNHVIEAQKPKNEDGDVKAIENRGSTKLEMAADAGTGESQRSRGKEGMTGKVKGKKRRTIAKNRSTENEGQSEENGFSGTRGRRFFKDAMENERKRRLGEEELQKVIGHKDQEIGLNIANESKDINVGVENRNEKVASSGEIMKGDEGKENSLEEVKEEAVTSKVQLTKPEYSKDDESGNTRDGISETDGKYGISERSFPDEVQVDKVDNDFRQTNAAYKNEEPEDLVVEEERAGYKEETDEAEF